MLTADQLAALRRIPSPTVANALERLGVPHNCTDAQVRCLFPDLGVMLGYAATAVVRSAKPADRPKFTSRQPYWDHIGRHPAPRVLVAQDLDQPPGGAYWGEVNGSIHKALGCVGVLTDGTVRDLDEVSRLGFHFFAAGVEVSHGYAHLEGYDEPVTVFGMRVSPGDLIHADKHGAVVIPAAVAGEVAAACRAVDEHERPMLELCRGPHFSTTALAELLKAETV